MKKGLCGKNFCFPLSAGYKCDILKGRNICRTLCEVLVLIVELEEAKRELTGLRPDVEELS